ncbi:hypothetical protein SVAN01_01448 [Stagonosporopsis vannaccii]|nr:hypothetical protein SVAN01_01448 [Stagonosporopsis vannaccii]
MIAARTLALAAIAGAGAAVNAMLHGDHQGEVIEMLPRADIKSTCAELPKLCTGTAEMYGHSTTITYLCPEITKTRQLSTVHVTVTTTTTVTPTPLEGTGDVTITSIVIMTTPGPFLTGESDITTTIHSTLTKYKTVTVIRSSDVPSEVTSATAVSITDYVSATIPSELTSLPTETEEPGFTVQTSTTPAVTPTSSSDFPTLSPPVINGTTTGILYSASVANSSIVHPTAFFPNTTSAHYAIPTLNVENRAAESQAKVTALKLGTPLMTLIVGMAIIAVAAA